MDERILFDRFHEALDVEPRPGAFERMRFELLNQPVALRRRPAFRMRFSKMGLRIAAAVVTAAIVIAVVAALIATHHSPTGSVPAGQGQNVTAYRSLMNSDYRAMDAATSSHCHTIQDPGCAAAVVPVDAALQHWIDDLSSFQTPPQFASIDGALRRHLSQAIADLNAAVAFQRANDESGFNLAMNAAVYERTWIDPATSAIGGSYTIVASSFRDAIGIMKQSLDGCINGTPGTDPVNIACVHLSGGQDCVAGTPQTCEYDVQNATTRVEDFLVWLVEYPASASQATKEADLQAHLAQTDTALLAMTNALLNADAVKLGSARGAYTNAIAAADGDVSALINS